MEQAPNWDTVSVPAGMAGRTDKETHRLPRYQELSWQLDSRALVAGRGAAMSDEAMALATPASPAGPGCGFRTAAAGSGGWAA